MRALIIAVLLCGCGAPKTVTIDKAGYEEEPLTEITVTEDCDDTGTYQLTARIDTTETTLDVSAAYVYTNCDGVDGTVSYSKTQDELATSIQYDAALTYADGLCGAQFQLDAQAEKPPKVSVGKACKHRGEKLIGKLEKCKLKKGKKGKCSLKI